MTLTSKPIARTRGRLKATNGTHAASSSLFVGHVLRRQRFQGGAGSGLPPLSSSVQSTGA